MGAAIPRVGAATLVADAAPASAQTRRTGGHSERLVARARRGDRVARATLVEKHMGLVRSVALRYRNLGLPAEDLVQEGAIGLLTAIDEYDPARGTSFSTYAFWRIRAAVTHAVTARGNVMRIPRPLLERRRQVVAAYERCTAAGHEPTAGELAGATKLPRDAVVEALAPVSVVSLDQPLGDGMLSGDRLAADARTQPDVLALARHENRALRAALQHLRPRKQSIVKRHFGIDHVPQTLTAIASELNLSPERARALKDEALRELAADLTAAGHA